MKADGALGRLAAVLVAVGCVAGIAQLHRAADKAGQGVLAGSVAAGDCAGAKRAEIERLKTAGEITAEQAMMRRQEIVAECAGP